MNIAFKNIINIQKKVKDTVNSLLLLNGYTLITDERYGDKEALLLQWTNLERNHAFQIIWDIRDHWFYLGEFNRTDHLNYVESNEIDFFPYIAFGVLFRNRYDTKFVEKIKLKIRENKHFRN